MRIFAKDALSFVNRVKKTETDADKTLDLRTKCGDQNPVPNPTFFAFIDYAVLLF